MSRVKSLFIKSGSCFYNFVTDSTDRKNSYILALAYFAPLTNRDSFERALPVNHHTIAARRAYHERAHIILLGGVHQVAQFFLVHRRRNRHVRYAAHIRQVIGAMVRGSVSAGNTRTVKAENNIQLLYGHIMYHLIVGPLHKAGVDITERDKSLCC